MREVAFTHQLKTTDEQFLDHLKIPGIRGKSLDEAKQIVANHFRTRKSPKWSFYSHGSPWHETDAEGCVMEKAEELLKGQFRNSWPPFQWMDLGVDPDWARGVREATTSISRSTWVSELSTAFALTGRGEFASRAMELMKSFVAQMAFELDPRFEEDHDTYFGGPADTTQMTSLRLFRWTDFLHCGAMHVPGLISDEDLFWLVKQIWFYTCQYYRLMDDPLRRDNHHLLDHGHVPFVMGMAFPEFKWSSEMVRQGAKVIRHHFGHNLQKDGAYAEHSAEYQYHVLFHFAHPLGVAKANGYKLFNAAQVAKIGKWVEFSARCGKPDGMLPAIGDSPGRPLLHLFGTLATPLMDKKLAAMARGLECVPGAHHYASSADVAKAMKNWKPGERLSFGISEYYTQERKAPDAKALPKPATCQYPYGGYTFFRSEWSPKADYLSVSHFSGDYGGHAHWDMMSFLLHTQGKTLIGDPAAWLYLDHRFYGHGGDQRKDRPQEKLCYRGYSYSMNAHNCLVMNDDTLKPLEAMNHGTFWGGWPPKHGVGIFHAGGPIEVAEVWHDANYPTRHRRFFVHVVGIGFVLVDLMSKRPNLSPHQYSQYFHFEGDVEISSENPGNGAALQAFDGEAKCLIVPGAETENRWRTLRDPYLDNVFGVKNSKGAPWIAELTRKVRGEAVFTHFILTNGAAKQTGARCRYLGAKPSAWLDWQHEGISANELDLGPVGKLLVASAPYKKRVASDELTTDAELAVVHLDASGKVKSWAMARGKNLTVSGKKLVEKKQEWVAR